MDASGLNIETYAVGHLPVVRAIMDELGIVQFVDRLPPMHSQARVSDGHCVAAMILNILSGRARGWCRRCS